jgi:hypothetical protein
MFCQMKKQKLNKFLDNIRLELSRFRIITWYSMEKDINDELELEIYDG